MAIAIMEMTPSNNEVKIEVEVKLKRLEMNQWNHQQNF